MTGKYTPGPWRKRGVNKMVCGPEGNTVADVRYKNGDADAQLIAAAPDLLEALVELIKDAEVCINIPASAYAALRKAGVIE